MASPGNDNVWHDTRAAQWNRQAGPPAWQPRADVCETAEGIHIEVEVPGLREEDLSLRFEPGALVIEGHRARPTHGSPSRCWQVEIEYGRLRRVLALPKDIDGSRIEARLAEGILSISAPRMAPASPDRTRITVR